MCSSPLPKDAVPADSADERWAEGGGQPAVVAMPAEIDVTNADQVRGALQAALDQGAAAIIADLSGTVFCDSRGLHALIGAHRRAAASGVRVLFVIGAGQVRRLFTLTGMDTVLAVYPSLGDALAEQTAPQDPSGPAADLPGGVKKAPAGVRRGPSDDDRVAQRTVVLVGRPRPRTDTDALFERLP
jgi:anti-sigma B factor antagonist